jgi:hypothetical protein
VLFSADAWPRLADGTITVTFRTWTRPQAKVGSVHRVGRDRIPLHVDAVAEVEVETITDDDARRAGEADLDALLERLGRRDGTVWRIDFHRTEPPPEREPPSEDVVRRRLERMGPWAEQYLRVIGEQPAVVSTVLAEQVGEERMRFKGKVRRLKALGLTESLDVGYRLTPLGEAVLRSRTGD